MRNRKGDLHGQAPDEAPVVLLLMDVMSTFDFEDGERLFAQTRSIVPAIADLRRRCKEHGVPVIYVNDNYGRWQSDWKNVVEQCLRSKYGAVLRPLTPAPDDYFVLKPKQSGFFSTTLETLLGYLNASTLIIAGTAGNICVQFTANDAYMRDFRVIVPRDCVASADPRSNERALAHFATVLKADTRPQQELDLQVLRDGGEVP